MHISSMYLSEFVIKRWHLDIGCWLQSLDLLLSLKPTIEQLYIQTHEFTNTPRTIYHLH